MKKVKIAGVPEHFNLPWHMCIENGEFEAVGIDLEWTDVPDGTGKMCQMLRDETTDIAIVLTEGIIKDICAGNNALIVQKYVESPLLWGIHVDAHSNFFELKDLEGKKAAVSRLGSGSHLMSIVNAENQKWDSTTLQFEIVHTIDGAVESLKKGTAHYFMWERFMTKPLVNNGTFRHIANCPTPWPCFVIAVRKSFLEKNKNLIKQILEIINNTTLEFKMIPSIDRTLAVRYHQKVEDIKEWLAITQWSQENLNEKMLNKIQSQLFNLNIIDKKSTFAHIVTSL